MSMDDLDPTCGKCHAPVTTGMMAMLCPYRETCEFWPDDPESQAFIKKYWPVPFGGSACEHEWQDGIYRPFEGLSLIHISEPTRQAEISYAVFCLKKKK